MKQFITIQSFKGVIETVTAFKDLEAAESHRRAWKQENNITSEDEIHSLAGLGTEMVIRETEVPDNADNGADDEEIIYSLCWDDVQTVCKDNDIDFDSLTDNGKDVIRKGIDSGIAIAWDVLSAMRLRILHLTGKIKGQIHLMTSVDSEEVLSDAEHPNLPDKYFYEVVYINNDMDIAIESEHILQKAVKIGRKYKRNNPDHKVVIQREDAECWEQDKSFSITINN